MLFIAMNNTLLIENMDKWSRDNDQSCQIKQITNVNINPTWAVLALVECKRNAEVKLNIS